MRWISHPDCGVSDPETMAMTDLARNGKGKDKVTAVTNAQLIQVRTLIQKPWLDHRH